MQISKETSDFIRQNTAADVRKLALLADKYPQINFPFALQQIAGRQIAFGKMPYWADNDAIIYPPHLSLEQASSEWTARYKATLLKGETLIDLTGGCGIDCAFLSKHFKTAVYVEKQPDLCEIARQNFRTLSLNHIETVCADAEEYLKGTASVDCIYMDPARRNEHGQKTVQLSDCKPDVTILKNMLLQKAATLWIKFSPMLDIASSLVRLPETQEIHVVSLENECKELLFKLQNKPSSEPEIHCVNLRKNRETKAFLFKRSEEADCICSFADIPQNYLYEPNASLLKAGAFKSITCHFAVKKLQINSHLYTSEDFLPNFPGRSFRILRIFSLNKNECREALAGIGQANVSVRNFPLSAQELKSRLKIKDGGDFFIFGTILMTNKKVLILCRKINE